MELLVLLLGFSVAAAVEPPPPAVLNLPTTTQAPRPLPFSLNHTRSAATNVTVGSDSRSLLLNGEPWYPVGGEIHFARVPRAQWHESLLRVRAGGIDMISVYCFWIHHEEHEGSFNFTGRRDVRSFLETAREVGLKVLLRVGPWDHGEVRNGGHPDWLLPIAKTKANPDGVTLRSTDSRYLAYVDKFFAALGRELDGMWWEDGGPLVFCQLENETGDWKYILALKDLAVLRSFKPVAFTRTGWPAPIPVPAAGFCGTTVNGTHADPARCAAYPVLPFFSGYPDVYWIDDMAPAPYLEGNAALQASYVFGNAQLPSQPMWGGFTDVPKLNVEIGGGMAVDYNHRPHMSPDDMPSLHLVDVADGVQSLGYYMYHGGLNPSPENGRNNDPSVTLQEGAWSAPGTQNGMPSVNYNYFSPLSDLGQPLPHYHTMRRMHLFLGDFAGEVVRASVSTAPVVKPDNSPDAPFDNSTLRWQVRSEPPTTSGAQATAQPGFLFVNNRQRLRNMTRKTDVRFDIHAHTNTAGNATSPLVSLPSQQSNAVTVEPDAFFVWPFFLALGESQGSTATLAWATAQIICRVESTSGSVTTTTLVLAASAGVPDPELAVLLSGPDAAVAGVCAGCTQADEAFGTIVDTKATVVRSLDLEAWRSEPALTISLGEDRRVQFVVLPQELADSVWRGRFAGADRVLISDPTQGGVETLVMATASGVELRSPAKRLDIAMLPPLISASSALRLLVDGAEDQPLLYPSKRTTLFDTYSVPMPATSPPRVTVKQLRDAGPARTLVGCGHKAVEPNVTEWQDAAAWSVKLDPPGFRPAASTDVRLRLRYLGDAARFKRSETVVLNDNWYTGYHGFGEMEAGLSFLDEEHGGALFKSDTNLTLHVLPLKRESLEDCVFLRSEFWPRFGEDGVAVGLDGVDVEQSFRARLEVPNADLMVGTRQPVLASLIRDLFNIYLRVLM